MRAMIVQGEGREAGLVAGEVPDPAPGEGEVLIRVSHAGVNRADLLQRRGLYPPPPGVTPILGLECAGEVAALGPGVAAWRPGDRIMALLPGGGYGELAVAPAGSVMAVPPDWSLAEAAGFPEVFLTAFLNLIELGGVAPGGTALVHGGSGGVGTAAIQILREIGARVLVTCGGPEKAARCRELGADAAIDHRRGPFGEAVRKAADGEGVDVVLDIIGGPYLQENLSCLRPGGKLVVIGLMGGARGELDLAPLLTRRLHIVGSTLRSRSSGEKAGLVGRLLRRFGSAMAAGRLRPVVDRVMPLEAAREAHDVLAGSGHFGKVVLSVAGA